MQIRYGYDRSLDGVAEEVEVEVASRLVDGSSGPFVMDLVPKMDHPVSGGYTRGEGGGVWLQAPGAEMWTAPSDIGRSDLVSHLAGRRNSVPVMSG